MGQFGCNMQVMGWGDLPNVDQGGRPRGTPDVQGYDERHQ